MAGKYGVLKRGGLACLDSFAGLVPCKVLRITHTDESKCGTFASSFDINATVRLTATRGAYRRGEVMTVPARTVVPRESVYTRSGVYYTSSYSVQVGAPFDAGARVQTPDGPGTLITETQHEDGCDWPRSLVRLSTMEAVVIDPEPRWYPWHELSEVKR